MLDISDYAASNGLFRITYDPKFSDDGSAFVIAAVRALALYLDPDNAEMFVEKRDEECGMGDETRVSDT